MMLGARRDHDVVIRFSDTTYVIAGVFKPCVVQRSTIKLLLDLIDSLLVFLLLSRFLHLLCFLLSFLFETFQEHLSLESLDAQSDHDDQVD